MAYKSRSAKCIVRKPMSSKAIFVAVGAGAGAMLVPQYAPVGAAAGALAVLFLLKAM